MALTAIAADGWQATVSSPVDLSLTPVAVSRQGFDATGASTTHNDVLYLTKRVRQAYPNQASFTADKVALSDYVYSTDTISGVTNNSTLESPNPVGNYVTPHRLLIGNWIGGTVCPVDVVGFHRNARAGKQLACVHFYITDGVNTPIKVTVATPTVSPRATDRAAVIVYALPLTDITALNAGLIMVNCEMVPWIGGSGSVFKSADQSASRDFSPRYFLKNTTLAAAPRYAFVSKSGSNGTGTTSTSLATAKATPYATFVGAIDGLHSWQASNGGGGIDGMIIVFGDDGGTPHVLGSPAAVRSQKVAAITLTRDPAVARANCRVGFGAAGWYPQIGSSSTFTSPIASGAIRLNDIAIVRTGAQAIGGDTYALDVIFDDVDFDNASTNFKWLTSSYGTTHDYWYGGAITNPGGVALAAQVNEQHCCWRGIACDANTSGIEGGLVVGCNWDRPGAIGPGVSGRSQSGSILAFNKLMRIAGSGNFAATISDPNDVNGFAIVQNLFETTGAGNATALWVEADSATGDTVHGIIHNNTLAGAWGNGRSNLFYDEGSTARAHKLMSEKGNIHVQINTKGDVFTSNGARIGNFAFVHGVGCEAEFSQYIDAAVGGFAQDYPGLNADIGASSTIRNDPLFTSYAGTTWNGTSYSAGAGGGDYTLQAGSPCIAMLPVAVLSHDLAGTVRPAANDNSGAYASVSLVAGDAAGSIGLTGAGTAAAPDKGSAGGSIGLAGEAAGVAPDKAAAAGGIDIAGSAAGAVPNKAATSGGIDLSGAASADSDNDISGAASGDMPLGGTATGSNPVEGEAAGPIVVSGSATGTAESEAVDGEISGTLPLSGGGAAQAPIAATAPGSIALEGAATAIRQGGDPVAGEAAGTIQFGGSASAIVFTNTPPPPVVPPGAVVSREGDTVDLVLWRHRGRTAGVTEQTLELNRGLADRPPLLPAGVIITLPPATAPSPVRETVKLWD